MLPAIDLDDQHCLDAGEVRDKGMNGMLAPEVPSADLAAAQNAPEFAFRIGGNAAHSARAGKLGLSGVRHGAAASAPSLTLPRFAGEGISAEFEDVRPVEKDVEWSHP
ncbi:hypothetical protein J2850_002688 [Azospirillum picis]|uniref:Uncharacterized protein n=1 Tax=Azospirillum picis TaxID=488438 RepID=A0ABU0MKQ6_9PROT|nr:hypothetical protein [Azospirillum picis]MDQ0533776.1 hypothetical protein [Azospirillum picis]